MNKEDLIKLKKHIASFTEEEQNIRDEYLRKLATGEIHGPMTGYPSIDNPQLQYYDMEEYHKKRPGENITYALMRQNASNINGIALEYFHSKYTYGEFFDMIGSLMKAFAANGVKEGDSVIVSLPGMPEGMTSVYALAGMGAIGVFMPPYVDIKSMVSDMKFGNTKILLIMDALYDAFKDNIDTAIKEAGIEKAIIVPTLNSSVLGKIKKSKPIPKGFISYNDFIKEGESQKMPKLAEYKENMPAAVVYSSGTTGILKGILLSHDTINNSAKSYYSFGFDLTRGQKIYQVIPPFASTGLIASGTTALYYGLTLYQNPIMKPDVFSRNLGLQKINWGVATTSLFEGLDELRKKKLFKLLMKTNIIDYRNLKNVYIGGTLTTEKVKENLNKVLASVGCPSQAKRSYGNCENGSIVTAELNGIDHPADSVGIPIPGVTLMIINEEGEEMQYNQRGEITVKTNCGMIDYYNRPELSKKIFFEDEAGIDVYKHTGDIGYISPSGDLIYEGRANDYSIVNGLKIYNFDVKNIIIKDNDVYDAEVLTNNDGVFCVHIQFFDTPNLDIEEKIVELQKKIFSQFGDINYVPEYFKIRKFFPVSKSTKRDILGIKAETDGFIYSPGSFLTKNDVKKLSL